jgi:hypothetical protein
MYRAIAVLLSFVASHTCTELHLSAIFASSLRSLRAITTFAKILNNGVTATDQRSME